MSTAVLAAGAMMLWPAGADAHHFAKRTLKVGMRGADVRVLQDFLTRAGHRTSVDGQFGRGTRSSLRSWERASGLRPDGKATISDQRRLSRVAPQAPAAESAPSSALPKATLAPDGTAIAPESAPQIVKDMIAAANEIHDKPYEYGGGHGESLEDDGYDCSGSMSYVFRKVGLLKQALDSTGFMRFGEAGAGQWVTTYANEGHSFMYIAGLRFDTSGRKDDNSRWDTRKRSTDGYVVRHPAGL